MQKVTVIVPMPRSGMTNDPRDTTPDVARVIMNFDTVTDPRRAIPYLESEDGDSNVVNDEMVNWCVGKFGTGDYRLYGLGRQTALSRFRIFEKILTIGSSNDLDDNGWTETANNLGGQTINMRIADTNLFMFYERTSYIYGGHTGTHIYRYDPSGSGAVVNTHYAIAYTNLCQGVVHSQDDIMYFGADNKVIKNDNDSFSVGITLPSEFYITSICEYGAYLAIACAPISGVGRSRVYLWNRSSMLATVSANIDWGQGVIKVLEELEGYLVGITQVGGVQSRNTNRVVFRYYAGSAGAKKFKEFNAGTSGVFGVTTCKQKIDNRVYFQATIKLNGTVRDGVWSIANTSQGLTVQHERTTNNDTVQSQAALYRFFFVGDFLFQSYANNSSAYAVSKSKAGSGGAAGTYSATSIIETVINPNMPPEYRHQLKKLIAVGAMYDPLPTAGQVVVKARVDTTGAYTTFFTETTDSAVYTEPVPIPSGGTFMNDGKEIEFQALSTGGAVPTAIIYVFEVEESNATP